MSITQNPRDQAAITQTSSPGGHMLGDVEWVNPNPKVPSTPMREHQEFSDALTVHLMYIQYSRLTISGSRT